VCSSKGKSKAHKNVQMIVEDQQSLSGKQKHVLNFNTYFFKVTSVSKTFTEWQKNLLNK